MRVVLLVPSFPKLSETFIVSKFLGLLERGWDVYVVCGESRRSEWEHFPELRQHAQARQRVRVSWPHRPRWLAVGLAPIAAVRSLGRNPAGLVRYLYRGFRRLGLDVLRRSYLDAELLQLRPDVIHFEFGALAVERMYLKELLGCRVVVSFRGYDLNVSGLEQPDYYNDVWANADAIHVLSEALRRRAGERGCPANQRITKIPPAVDLPELAYTTLVHRELQPGSPVWILSVGRFTWEKGLEYGLQAVGELVKSGVEFQYRMVGEGRELDAVTFIKHHVDQAIRILQVGTLPPERIREELQRADVFLHPAVSEGFCNAVLEAQAMGVPVVCTDAGALPENVIDGVTGFVVPRRDPRALAEKLALLARDPALRKRMGEAGRQRVREHFRIEDQIGKFESLYRSLD